MNGPQYPNTSRVSDDDEPVMSGHIYEDLYIFKGLDLFTHIVVYLFVIHLVINPFFVAVMTL